MISINLSPGVTEYLIVFGTKLHIFLSPAEPPLIIQVPRSERRAIPVATLPMTTFIS